MIDAGYMKKKFLSKESIANINKCIIDKVNISPDISKDLKKEIILVIIKHMKMVYKNIDNSKVDENNINIIFNQFKDHSINESYNEVIKLSNIKEFMEENTKINKKSSRDFFLSDRNENKVMERPSSSVHKENNELAVSNKPNISKNDNDSSFNNYTVGKGNNVDKFSDVKNQRQLELNNTNKIPDIPDFLMSKSTSVRKDEKLNDAKKNNIVESVTKDDTCMYEAANNTSLFSISNFSKPLIDDSVIIDENNNISFNEKLKLLQENRNLDICVNDNKKKTTMM